MSIFKETFPTFVTKQLKVREDIIASGAGKSDSSFNFKESRSEQFYTYSLNKQCVLRMSSAVNIEDKTLEKELSYIGAELAKNWVLEGGIKSGNTNRFGIGAKGAYGDPDLRADAKDGYGIVPMPGITNAQIRTKSAYGSLREAKVNFVCHNIRQLEILELLYMRPGYTLMLEWGWDPFINNEGKIDTWSFIDGFFGDDLTTQWIEKEILKKKEDTGGNYDALMGYCKNFEYTLREDGGFNCSTEIIAKGEILSSLKDTEALVSDNNYSLKGETTGEGIIFSRPSLELLLEDLCNYADDLELIGDDDEAQSRGATLYKKFFQALNPGVEAPELTESVGPNSGREDNSKGDESLKPWIIADGPQGYQTKSYGTLWNDDEAVDDGKAFNLRDARTTSTWIRWDAFCHLLNTTVIPKDQFGNPLIELQTNRIANEHTEKPGEKPEIKPLLYVNHIPWLAPYLSEITGIIQGKNTKGKSEKAKMDWNLVDISTNNQICMLPHNLHSHGLLYKEAVITDSLFPPLAKSLANHVMNGKPKPTNFNINYNEQSYQIGGIYLGVEYMLSKFRELYYDEDKNRNKDYSLFKFLKEVWEGVNGACGNNHEFDLHTDNRPDGKIVRIIDLLAGGDAELDLTNIHELKIQSLDSIVRDISYNTTIPSELSATIAIAAQAPDSVDDLNKVTFAALNRGIRDRFATRGTNTDGVFSKLGETNQRKLWEREFDTNLQAVFSALYIKEENLRADVETALGEYSWWEIGGLALLAGTLSLTGLGIWAVPLVIGGALAMNIADEQNTNFGGILRDLLYYQYTLNNNGLIRHEDTQANIKNEGEEIATYQGSLKSLHKALNYFSKVYGSTKGEEYYIGQPYNGASRTISSIIPLNFNAKLDGIGGIIIGNVFKLPKSRVPVAYSRDDIHFIVMTEEQEITAGQDWTTTITGQLTLLGGEEQTNETLMWTNSWNKGDRTVENTVNKENIELVANSANTARGISTATGETGGYNNTLTNAGLIKGVESTNVDHINMGKKLMASLGLTDFQAAGIVGNMIAESNVEHARRQNKPRGEKYPLVVDGKTGYGLVQWTSENRQQNLWDHAESKGHDMTKPLTLEIEYSFLLVELGGDYKYVIDDIKQTTNLYGASTIFMTKFERPADQSDAKKKERAVDGDGVLLGMQKS
jgi:hypothetical protein